MTDKPTAYNIVSYYGKYLKYGTTHPCRDPSAKNQCAVRLSMAIEGNSPGFIDEFEPQNRVHRDRVTCNNLPPHVLGAAELGRYLIYKWGAPYTYRSPEQMRLVRQVLKDRYGVVWFINCYKNEAGNLSDHIDMWNGYHYMNELLKESAGGNASAADDLFSKSAGGVCFFPMV
jgi:Type VI secretion system (T6SS), amidase effector protein 4